MNGINNIETEMDDKMEAYVKDLIAGAFKYSEKDKAFYIKKRLEDNYKSSLNWSVFMAKGKYSTSYRYTKPFYFSCIFDDYFILIIATDKDCSSCY